MGSRKTGTGQVWVESQLAIVRMKMKSAKSSPNRNQTDLITDTSTDVN